MSVVSSIVDEVLKLHGLPAYALVGGLAFSEAALFVGFVLPGETAVILGDTPETVEARIATGLADLSDPLRGIRSDDLRD